MAWDGLNPPYSTIVADPPWNYEGKTPPWRSTSRPAYSLMSVADIRQLPVDVLATGDAHLYLWTVLPMMAEAFAVVESWGFTADTMLTWCKPGVGLGAGFRGNTEHLIVARRGFFYINPTCAQCGGGVPADLTNASAQIQHGAIRANRWKNSPAVLSLTFQKDHGSSLLGALIAKNPLCSPT